MFELALHKQFSSFRINGEWFKFPSFMKFEEMKELEVNFQDYMEKSTLKFTDYILGGSEYMNFIHDNYD